jgi:hypothetical protein
MAARGPQGLYVVIRGPQGWGAMAETDPQERLQRLETALVAVRGEIAAHAIVIDFLVRAIASVDGASSEAIAMALEVAEMDHIDTHGETEISQALRRTRERLGFALPADQGDDERA